MAVSARGIRAGKATIELSMSGSKVVQKQLQSLQAVSARIGSVFNTIGTRMLAVGGTIGGALGGAVGIFNSVGDSLAKASDRTGLTVEALSELGYAAAQSGTSMEALEKGIRGMSRNILDAGRGLATAKDNFADLGVALEDLEGATPEEQFLLLAGKVSAIEDPTRKAALAMKIFGKSGVELLPMLTQGIEGVDALRQRARELGLVMSGEDAKAAVTLGDLFADLWRQVRRVAEIIGASLATELSAIADVMTRVAATGLAWLNQNRTLVLTIAKVTAGVLAIGGALVGLGLTFTVISFAAGGLASAVGLLATVLAALVSPVGLIVGGLAALTAWFATSTNAGRAMVRSLVGWFGELQGIATDTFGGITAALASGDFALAGRVAMAGLNAAWLQGTNALREKWRDFKSKFLELTIDLVYGAIGWWKTFVANLKQLWSSAVTSSKSAGEKIGHYLSRSSDPAVAADQDRAHEQALKNIEAEGRAARAEIDAERDAELGKLAEQHALALKLQQEKADAAQKAADDEVAAAKEALRLATQEAEEKKRALQAARDAAVQDLPQIEMAEAALQGVAVAARQTQAQGVFDTRLARQMFGGQDDRMVRHLANIDRNTRRRVGERPGIPVGG